ncbi:FadR/GntR family transcriptional regulator [Cohaesibacter celericrescens]|uniref:GntR family transcriptional regulator n=1 Tax=Cohaesibacter celericrescens TaxID=2067669 RepID=A0A2N5XUW0_9HYPH|nr:FadR/GntR family transcriptional regulator [Cohaesibacter celericrescens]PLW78260.1 GntR family transcriptional regulator [Cohaesibacter celericrescens]
MSSPKVDLAISLVKNLIQTGDLRPGDRLPNETEFSAQLGVSRNSLREAVRAMQAMQILEARQGDGTYVSGLDPSKMIETLRFAVDVSGPQSVMWFLEIRRTLELYTIGIAAAKRSKSDMERLKQCHQKLMNTDDPDVLLEMDTEFHRIIAETSQNPILISLLNVVSGPAHRARVWRNRQVAQQNRTRSEHEAILAKIEEQDVEGAKYAMWAHLSGVTNWIKENPDRLSGLEQEIDLEPQQR